MTNMKRAGELFDRYLADWRGLGFSQLAGYLLQARRAVMEYCSASGLTGDGNIDFVPVISPLAMSLSQQMHSVQRYKLPGKITTCAGAFCCAHLEYKKVYFLFDVCLNNGINGGSAAERLKKIQPAGRLPLREVEIIAVARQFPESVPEKIAALDSDVLQNSLLDIHEAEQRRQRPRYLAVLSLERFRFVLSSAPPENLADYLSPCCRERKEFN